MSIYTNAIYGMRKRAYDGPPMESPYEANSADYSPEVDDFREDALALIPNTSAVAGIKSINSLLRPTMTPADLYKIDTVVPGLMRIINNPNASTADKLQAAYKMQQLGRGSDVPLKAIATGALDEIKAGVKSDLESLRNRLHKKYTVLRGDARARFNKFKKDLPGMYAEGKKQLGDFYDANKSAIWAGGLGALGGGTIGASVAKNKLLGGLVGAGVGAGVSLGALRIAKYLGYDI